MSAQDVQTLRDAYAAFGRQDIPAVLAAFDEGIEWTTPETLPYGGTCRGHDGVLAFFGELGRQWQELSVEPQEFLDAGDAIVVLARDRGAGAGGPLDVLAVHLWRMRDGKAVSFTETMDTASVLKALGTGVPAQA
jgi:ketosteroid isomerase-like protein